MKRLAAYIKSNPIVAVSLLAGLCFVQFLVRLVLAISSGTLNGSTINQLMSTADGFEAVVLFGIMIVLRSKDK